MTLVEAISQSSKTFQDAKQLAKLAHPPVDPELMEIFIIRYKIDSDKLIASCNAGKPYRIRELLASAVVDPPKFTVRLVKSFIKQFGKAKLGRDSIG